MREDAEGVYQRTKFTKKPAEAGFVGNRAQA